MTGFIKDDLTVALDDVDRIGSRIETIYRDLAALAGDPAVARLLEDRAHRLHRRLESFNRARQAHQQMPEVEEPERAHLQALWLKLKSLAIDPARDELTATLDGLDQQLAAVVRTARSLEPPADIDAALAHLASFPAD